MGDQARHAVLVTAPFAVRGEVDLAAFRQSMPEHLRPLFVGPIPTLVNGAETWLLAPDGSKEGWEEAEVWAQWRAQLIELTAGWRGPDGEAMFEVVWVRYGLDIDGAAEILLAAPEPSSDDDE